MANADYTNLSEREKKKLISKYVSKFREALGGIGTNESLASRMVKELRQIGSSDLINDINEAYDEKHNETLRDAIIGDYSGDDEDGMLNSLGFAIDRVGDKSLKLENQDRALLSANNRDLKGSSLDLINEYENVIVARTFSKAFGVPSIRLGFLLTNEKNMEIISNQII